MTNQELHRTLAEWSRALRVVATETKEPKTEDAVRMLANSIDAVRLELGSNGK